MPGHNQPIEALSCLMNASICSQFTIRAGDKERFRSLWHQGAWSGSSQMGSSVNFQRNCCPVGRPSFQSPLAQVFKGWGHLCGWPDTSLSHGMVWVEGIEMTYLRFSSLSQSMCETPKDQTTPPQLPPRCSGHWRSIFLCTHTYMSANTVLQSL